MNRKMTSVVICASLVVVFNDGVVFAQRGGGRGGGGGGFRGGGGGGYGGMRSGGMSSMSRTPSFRAVSGSRPSAASQGTAQGPRGGQVDYGSRSGSYTTARGGTVNYGGAGAAGQGAGGGTAGKGVYGISGTTAGGKDGTVGRAGAATGPGGNSVAGRSSIGAVSGPGGTAVGGSRGAAASGAGGNTVAGRSSFGAASGPGGTAVAGSRGFAASGAGGTIAGGSSTGAYRSYGSNAYGGYHQGWVHGSWNGNDSAAWGWHGAYWGSAGAWGVGAAIGLGWGLASWGFGSSLYGMGYMPYSNPYYSGGATSGTAAPYDYSQPIDTVSAPAAESVTDPATALFDDGRAIFKEGNYADALKKTDDALAKLPNDTTLHEFRGLCLFALGRYDESAATLYAVLSVGPGWDWTTLISLYPSVDVYTKQLRTLEEYCSAHPESATARFVLVYHYLTEGFTDAAVPVLKQVVALKPTDSLATKLLHQLDPPKDEPAKVASPAPADTTPPQGASIAGTWNAEPAAGTSIALVVKPGGAFDWQATVKGRKQQFTGTSTYGEGILTLAQDKGPALVGRVSWKDANHMTFRVVGDGPDEPGLSFAK